MSKRKAYERRAAVRNGLAIGERMIEDALNGLTREQYKMVEDDTERLREAIRDLLASISDLDLDSYKR